MGTVKTKKKQVIKETYVCDNVAGLLELITSCLGDGAVSVNTKHKEEGFEVVASYEQEDDLVNQALG